MKALVRAVVLFQSCSIKLATMGGIGLFLAIIGFENAGLVVAHPVTLVTLGDLRQPLVALSLLGLVIAAVLMARRVQGALLVTILGLAAVAPAEGQVVADENRDHAIYPSACTVAGASRSIPLARPALYRFLGQRSTGEITKPRNSCSSTILILVPSE